MRLFFGSLMRYLALTLQALCAPFRAERRLPGALLVLFALPVFVALQLLHWVTFLVDEIVFRGYRQIEIRSPVFVLGPPRSGTTYLHHVLAADAGSTTFRAWECLFGLSVTSRRIILGLAAVDRAIGRPLGRIGEWVGRRLSRTMDDIHPVGLGDPEEDFLCLMPLAACFLLIIPFPRADWLWPIVRCDEALDDRSKRELMAWYRACIQKHLYVFGQEKRFLSKNASFSGMATALLDAFPDARILVTTRDPIATVPSQLSSLRPALKLCGFPRVNDELRDRLIDLLRFYYEHLAETAASQPDRVAMLYNDDLRNNPDQSVRDALAAVGVDTDAAFRGYLRNASVASRQHRSGHRYTLEEFGLDQDLIALHFEHIYELYDFRRAGPGQESSQ